MRQDEFGPYQVPIKMVSVFGYKKNHHFTVSIHYKDGQGNICVATGLISQTFSEVDLINKVERALEHGYGILGVEYGGDFPENRKIDLPTVVGEWVEEHFGEEDYGWGEALENE